LAYFCVVRGLRAVAAFEASLILLAEPALNPVWSWLVHGEEPGVRVILGGLLILLATAARAWLGTRPGRAAYVRVEPMPDWVRGPGGAGGSGSLHYERAISGRCAASSGGRRGRGHSLCPGPAHSCGGLHCPGGL